MNKIQTVKTLERVQALEHDIEQLRGVRTAIATTGYASATLASGGGTQSYTRLDLDKITNVISQMEKELKQLIMLLATKGKASNSPMIQTYTFWG